MPDEGLAKVVDSTRRNLPGRGETGIRLTARLKGLKPNALAVVRLRLVLDDGPAIDVAWGDTFLPVRPGPHTLRCHFSLFIRRAGGTRQPR